MKELKDLLKADKYLEAKAFILSNLDKIEECIDDVLEELVERESLRPLCITTEEINQDLKNKLIERMGKESSDRFQTLCAGIGCGIPENKYVPPTQYADAHQKDKERPWAWQQFLDEEVIKQADILNKNYSEKANISEPAPLPKDFWDEHEIISPKGVDLSYLKDQYHGLPSEEMSEFIEGKIKLTQYADDLHKDKNVDITVTKRVEGFLCTLKKFKKLDEWETFCSFQPFYKLTSGEKIKYHNKLVKYSDDHLSKNQLVEIFPEKLLFPG